MDTGSQEESYVHLRRCWHRKILCMLYYCKKPFKSGACISGGAMFSDIDVQRY
jgi:hypothetical protein